MRVRRQPAERPRMLRGSCFTRQHFFIAMILASLVFLALFSAASNNAFPDREMAAVPGRGQEGIKDNDLHFENFDDNAEHADKAVDQDDVDAEKEQAEAAAEQVIPVEAGARQNNVNVDIDKTSSLEKQLASLLAQVDDLKAQMKQQMNAPGGGKSYPEVRFRNEQTRKRILVTGGTGFVGSHLVDKLMHDGHEVIALDNYFTGRKRNVEHWLGHPNFELVHHDVVNPYFVEVDHIYHLASPASPPHYMYNPVKTIKTNTIGTINMLGLAKRVKARVLLASTSEIYGDPEVHPQPETYWGHVNTIGPRACYDEGKRVAESLMVAYNKQENVTIRIARIFNTFGPRMHMNDGRVVSNFVIQALRRQPITIYGDGSQTRSFQYVSDLVDGLVALMNSDTQLPVNIGNPEEHTINEFAEIIRQLVGSSSEVVHHPSQQDDPKQRKPDIRRAAELLKWSPQVKMHEGLRRTIEYFRKEIADEQKALQKAEEAEKREEEEEEQKRRRK